MNNSSPSPTHHAADGGAPDSSAGRASGPASGGWRTIARRIPGLRLFYRWARAFFSLARTSDDVSRLRDLHYQAFNQSNQRLARLESYDILNRFSRLEALDIPSRLHAFDLVNVGQRLKFLEDLRVGDRLAAMEEGRFGEDVSRELARLDQVSEEEIARRLRIYQPLLGLGENLAGRRMLDLRCGSGEWLAALRDKGIEAVGADVNGEAVAACRQRQLDAEHEAPMSCLRRQAEGSLDAVMGFGVLETLSLEALVGAFKAAFRGLKTGGVLVFEAFNPNHVGAALAALAENPARRRLVAPALAEYLAREAGFGQVQILTVGDGLPAESTRVEERFAMIARKTGGE